MTKLTLFLLYVFRSKLSFLKEKSIIGAINFTHTFPVLYSFISFLKYILFLKVSKAHRSRILFQTIAGRNYPL
jgi:hypothetical protein